MSSKFRRSISPENLYRAGQQLKELPYISADEIRKIWGDGLVGSLLMHNLELMRQSGKGGSGRKDSEADSGYGHEIDGRGQQAKHQPRTETGQFRKRRVEEEEEGYGRGDNESGGQTGRRRRRRSGSYEHGEEDLNTKGDFRGWQAESQPRAATGQFKPSGGPDELSDTEGGRGRRRRRSRSRSMDRGDGRGKVARSLPRTETGQFKKRGEHDDLRERGNGDESDDGGRLGDQSRTGTGQFRKSGSNKGGRDQDLDYDRRKQVQDPDWEEQPWETPDQETHTPGWNANVQPRRETGQFKKKGEEDDLGKKHDREEQDDGRRSGQNQHQEHREPGWNAKYQPRDPETGQFKPTSDKRRGQFKDQEPQNRQSMQNQEHGEGMVQPTEGRRREAVRADQKVKQLAEMEMLPE